MPSPHSASASAMLFSAPVRLSRPSFGSVYRPQHPLSRPSSRSSTCPRASISRRSFRSVSSHRLPTLFPLALSRHSSPRSTSLSRLPSSRRSYPPLLLSSPASSGKIIPRKTEKNDKNEKRIRPDRRVSGFSPWPYSPFLFSYFLFTPSPHIHPLNLSSQSSNPPLPLPPRHPAPPTLIPPTHNATLDHPPRRPAPLPHPTASPRNGPRAPIQCHPSRHGGVTRWSRRTGWRQIVQSGNTETWAYGGVQGRAVERGAVEERR